MFALLVLVGCKGESGYDPWKGKPGPKVLVTFAPLYSFVKQVAGPDVTVVSMLTQSGPHGFDPTDNEARLVANAEVFFIVGLSLDDQIVDKLSKSRTSKLHIVELGEALDPKSLKKMAHEHAHAPGEAHHHHEHGEHDPHVWLGIPQTITMVKKIASELGEIDPPHKADYESRATAYIAKLEKLQADGKAMLKDKKERSIVTFHESLTYFADSFDLKIAGVIQVDPGVEPSRSQMNDIIKVCKENKVRLIAVEPQFPSNTAAKSVLESVRGIPGLEDAEFVEIDPFETANPEDLSPDLYEKVMRQNLANLAKALK